jgi:hypothetical protein
MATIYTAEIDNYTAESLELVKHHLRHEFHYKRSDYMWRERFNANHRIFTHRNGKKVSYCEAFEHKDGTIRFTRTKRLD